MRRHLSYANVVATLALVFAMSGGALAAKHYLIDSTKQISPKVLKKLRGNTGPRGARGATGASGAPGKEGPPGKQGNEGRAAPTPETISSTAASVGFAPGAAAEIVTKVELPRGTYTLLASTLAENNSATGDEAECVLLDTNNAFDGQKVNLGPLEGTALITLPAVLYTVAEPSEELSLACKSEKTAEGQFTSIQLLATKGADVG